jgi:hypothetical protein
MAKAILKISIYPQLKREDIKEFLVLSEHYINLERKYSYFQLVKALNFMGITYKHLFMEDKYKYKYKLNKNINVTI